MTIHEKIKHIRSHKKMTQIEFAGILQITQAQLSYIEKGEQVPSYHVIWELVNKLQVNPYYLLTEDKTVFDTRKRFSNLTKRNEALKYIDKAVEDIKGISL
jgi:transcriptional regulator with XRE-family HTH domain